MDPTLPGDKRLDGTFRALARDDAALRPSPRVEAHLRARVQALRQSSGQALRQSSGQAFRPGSGQALRPEPHPAPARATWHAWASAAAAGLLFILIWRVVPSEPPERLIIGEVASPALSAEFLPLPYAHVPVASGHIVRMSVPRAALATFGLDPGRADSSSTVLADVFVGEDGIARSVRFVDPAIQEATVQ